MYKNACTTGILTSNIMLLLITESVPSPPMIMAMPTSPTSITVTWDHLSGGPDVDSFEINYNYILNECSSVRNQTVNVIISNSSQRSYIIENGPDTPVEEDSRYSISIIARNSVGRSEPSSVEVTTLEAGTCYIISLHN